MTGLIVPEHAVAAPKPRSVTALRVTVRDELGSVIAQPTIIANPYFDQCPERLVGHMRNIVPAEWSASIETARMWVLG